MAFKKGLPGRRTLAAMQMFPTCSAQLPKAIGG
jgi:hypothetical protein